MILIQFITEKIVIMIIAVTPTNCAPEKDRVKVIAPLESPLKATISLVSP